ncbi:class II aminotransferase/8-amino-7-oxononanoate synthase [Aspergillus indologenus CBS 114.80]|uniref:Class II aminotransferase/8-amino-7-oxononanoate synthase n=1 Tax=Aspergillus indologenus CBS 114.80 TaxID=1450541 RepID=A0A2V5I0K9_9EURO|nr:class II aminotransferase/8-amino-7-oxononanoate synthase [Aspergillus indologenus CBS 114.80]
MAEDKLYSQLQTILQAREDSGRLLKPCPASTLRNLVDFGTNDCLDLSSSRILSKKFLTELESHPGFLMGSCGSRMADGMTAYLEQLERFLADFHSSEAALLCHSGYAANVALWACLPQPGDAVLYDEAIHASIHDGLHNTRATHLCSFSHNNLESLRFQILEILSRHPSLASGESSVFIAIESFYSLLGDAAPVCDIVAMVKELLPAGNGRLIIDEAHSNGVIGPSGAGLVAHHGLESEFTVRLHTCGKALGSTGGIILCKQVVKDYLCNYARNIVFTTAPSFPLLAMIKAGYNIIGSEEGNQRRHRLQLNIRHFYHTLTTHRHWPRCKATNQLVFLTEHNWRSQSFLSPIVAFTSRDRGRHGQSLRDFLHECGVSVIGARYPLVPAGEARTRLVIHADHTQEQIDDVVRMIVAWSGICTGDSESGSRL